MEAIVIGGPGRRFGIYNVTAPIGEGVSTPPRLLATGPSKTPRT